MHLLKNILLKNLSNYLNKRIYFRMIMNNKNLVFCFDITKYIYTIVIVVIILNITFLQISFCMDQTNNNQTTKVQTDNEIKKIVEQGIFYSKSFVNQTNSVVILSPKNNESIYNGIITYSSDQPVNIGIQHNINTNYSKVNLSKMHSSNMFENKKFFTSVIYPDYFMKEKMFSSSIPFVGNALTINYEKPFFVIYSVFANIEKYQKLNSQNSAVSNNQIIKNQLMDPFSPPTAYPTYSMSSTILLKEVLPYLSDEILSQLPFDKLPTKECTQILEKLSKEEHKEISCNKK